MTRHADVSLTQMATLGAPTDEARWALAGLDAAVAADRAALEPMGSSRQQEVG